MNTFNLFVTTLVAAFTLPELVKALNSKRAKKLGLSPKSPDAIIGFYRDAVKRLIIAAFFFLFFYGYLVYFSEESRKLFGSTLFEQTDKISILADVCTRAFALIGLPVLALGLLAIILWLLHETPNAFTEFIKKKAVAGLKFCFFYAIAWLFILGLNIIANGNVDYIKTIISAFTWYNISMYLCIPGMFASATYLMYASIAVIITLPDLAREIWRKFHYKPKH